MKKLLHVPLTAAGKGLANISTYSASASAWFSFPLKIIWTAPWGRKNKQDKRKEGSGGELKGFKCLYLGTHDGNLSCGPGVVYISSQVLGAHHIIGSSISLRTQTQTHTFIFILNIYSFLSKVKRNELFILTGRTLQKICWAAYLRHNRFAPALTVQCLSL